MAQQRTPYYLVAITAGVLLLGAGCQKPDLLARVQAKISDARLFAFSNEAPAHTFAKLEAADCAKNEKFNTASNSCDLACVGEACGTQESAIAARGFAIWNKYVNADRENDDFSVEDETSIVEYDVDNGKLLHQVKSDVEPSLRRWQKDKIKLARPWKLFSALFPKGQRDIIDHYVLYTDGSAKSAASLSPNGAEEGTYSLYVDIIDAYPKNTFDADSLTYFFIHEFGHVLTLNHNEQADEVEIDEDEDCTKAYNSLFGCMRQASYLNQFYDRFWKPTWGDFQKIGENGYENALLQQQGQWYVQHEGWFVTEYAAVNPEEDIAETWAAFVLTDKPGTAGTVADQKILFFYDQPELVALRAAIRHRLTMLGAV